MNSGSEIVSTNCEAFSAISVFEHSIIYSTYTYSTWTWSSNPAIFCGLKCIGCPLWDHPACYQCSIQKQHKLLSRLHLFQGRPCIFQQDNTKQPTVSITTAWLHNRRIWVLEWPAGSPDLLPTENILHTMKCKIQWRRPRTVKQLESYIRQEWHSIPLSEVQQLVSSVPSGKHGPVPTFWDVFLPSKSRWANILHETVKYLAFNRWFPSFIVNKVFLFMRFVNRCFHFTQCPSYFRIGLYI